MEYYRYGELSPAERLKIAIRNLLIMDQKLRPLNDSHRPGGLLEFPADDRREVIVIGDLHANKRNLKAILMDEQNLYKLKDNKAVLLFLGDAVHDERVGHLQAMESSIEIMDIIIHLISDYPENVFYLVGNHDTFSPQLGKSGIKQGQIYHHTLLQRRGQDYVNLMQSFFNSLPVFVIHPCFLAVHAGPVRGGIYRDELINIRHPDKAHLLRQLTWNRLNETRSSASKKEYSPVDLIKQRQCLGSPPELPIVVGHNPMWKWGTEDSVWVDILGAENHVILYSNLINKCTYLSFKDSPRYQIRQAPLKIVKQKYLLGEM